jgi:glucose-1-phosphate thymidylyltransferase
MKAIIPVAGVGTRLKPHTNTIPKVLLNVAGKPIISHILDKLANEGVKDIILVIGYLGDKIQHYIKEKYKNLNVKFVEQMETKGLGHAIYITRNHFGDEPVLIVLGDTVFDIDLKSVLKSKHSSLGVKHVEDPRRFGIAVLRNGFISDLIEKPEKPKSNLVVVGLYLIKNGSLLKKCLIEEIDRDIMTRGEYQLTDALQLMIDKGEKFTTFTVDGWYDCGKPETLLSTNRFLLDKSKINKKIAGSVVIPPVFVAHNAKVNNSVIGPYATIGNNAEITNSVVKDSIIGDNAKVINCLLNSSLIGANAVVEGSFKKLNVGDSSEVNLY